MLNVTNLHVGYGQSEALHGIDFHANKNETVAIMGRNGMGKTTLFKSLIGILALKSGSIEIDGQDISKDESYQRVAKGVAYVPQGRMIFSTLSVTENIQTGLENAKDKRIPDEIYALFPVLFDKRNRKGGNLSGGQQQQLAIARALAMNPALLLADEPTGNLDSRSADSVFDLLTQVNQEQGTTVLFVTHNAALAKRCKDLIEVVDGHIVSSGDRPS